MFRRLFVCAVAILLATLSAGSRSSLAVPSADIYVHSGPLCAIAVIEKSSIHEAVAAASPGYTIYVCPGIYVEPSITIPSGLTGLHIIGPGITPEDDGTAFVQRDSGTGSAVFDVQADGVTIAGFDIDATPASQSTTSYAIWSSGDATDIERNDIHGANAVGVLVSSGPASDQSRIQYNTAHDNASDIICGCTNSTITENTVNKPTSPGGFGISVQNGSGNSVNNNGFAGANIYISNESNTSIDHNHLDDTGGEDIMIDATGSGLMINSNEFVNVDSVAIVLKPPASSDTSTAFYNNTFLHVRTGFWLLDPDLNDSAHVTAVIGGSAPNGNTFLTPPNDYGVQLSGVSGNINAEFNNWGLCTLDQIEQHMYHHPDSPELGTVDYDPFISPDPGDCPTPSPTPSPTLSPSPTHSPSPTPSPTATPHRKWGDVRCNGTIDTGDVLTLALYAAGVPGDGPVAGCPHLGDDVTISAAQLWGDTNCDNAIDEHDALDVLASLAGVPFEPKSGCPRVGDTVTVATS